MALVASQGTLTAQLRVCAGLVQPELLLCITAASLPPTAQTGNGRGIVDHRRASLLYCTRRLACPLLRGVCFRATVDPEANVENKSWVSRLHSGSAEELQVQESEGTDDLGASLTLHAQMGHGRTSPGLAVGDGGCTGLVFLTPDMVLSSRTSWASVPHL